MSIPRTFSGQHAGCGGTITFHPAAVQERLQAGEEVSLSSFCDLCGRPVSISYSLGATSGRRGSGEDVILASGGADGAPAVSPGVRDHDSGSADIEVRPLPAPASHDAVPTGAALGDPRMVDGPGVARFLPAGVTRAIDAEQVEDPPQAISALLLVGASPAASAGWNGVASARGSFTRLDRRYRPGGMARSWRDVVGSDTRGGHGGDAHDGSPGGSGSGWLLHDGEDPDPADPQVREVSRLFDEARRRLDETARVETESLLEGRFPALSDEARDALSPHAVPRQVHTGGTREDHRFTPANDRSAGLEAPPQPSHGPHGAPDPGVGSVSAAGVLGAGAPQPAGPMAGPGAARTEHPPDPSAPDEPSDLSVARSFDWGDVDDDRPATDRRMRLVRVAKVGLLALGFVVIGYTAFAITKALQGDAGVDPGPAIVVPTLEEAPAPADGSQEGGSAGGGSPAAEEPRGGDANVDALMAPEFEAADLEDMARREGSGS